MERSRSTRRNLLVHCPHEWAIGESGDDGCKVKITLKGKNLYKEQDSRNAVIIIMQSYSTETTIRLEGELHLEHLPFHSGEKVKIVIVPWQESDNSQVRREEYEAFMRGYSEGDSIYDV